VSDAIWVIMHDVTLDTKLKSCQDCPSPCFNDSRVDYAIYKVELISTKYAVRTAKEKG
jgi:hypothetical protein